MRLFHETLEPSSNTSRSSADKTTAAADRLTLRVWLVDDDEALRDLMADLLNRHAGIFCPRQFPSTEAALEALTREAPPDALLLDINLRGHNGLDAIAPMKALAPSLRVLMLTTFFDSVDERRALEAGASGFLLKSYDLEQIVQSIQAACDGQESSGLFSSSNLRRSSKPQRAGLPAFPPAAEVASGPKSFGRFRALLAKLAL